MVNPASVCSRSLYSQLRPVFPKPLDEQPALATDARNEIKASSNEMRCIFIVVLCAPLILCSSRNADVTDNEIPTDETDPDKILLEGPTSKIDESDFEDDSEHEEKLNLEETYKDSVQAYLEEDWDGCIEGFTEAIEGYKEYKKAVIQCRRDCRDLAAGSQPIFSLNIEDLHFYEKKVRETLCLLKCSQNYRDANGADFLKRLPKDIEKKFVDLAAYEYLQICYYQKNRTQDAANAVYTYLTAHPKHEMSSKNLRYYVDLPNVEESKITNLEAEPYAEFYEHGVKAYDEERYNDVINNFEKSLKLYLKSEEDCRFYCEGPFNQGWLPEFTSSVANHFTYCLKCKQFCSIRMNHINGEYYSDLLPSHYHYLQFAYYKMGDIKNACAAVSSYLLFYPSDETMLKNERYYGNLPKVEKEYFEPRQEAKEYARRQDYEKHLSRFILDEFRDIEARLNHEKKVAEETKSNEPEDQLTHHPPPGHSPAFERRLSNDDVIQLDERRTLDKDFSRDEEFTDPKEDIRVIANGNELGGELRYLAEGFLNSTECESLVHLAQVGAVEGDGYEDNISPHSKYERFEGLTIGRAALLVYFGLLKPEVLELALSSTGVARDHVQRYFNLHRHLYFTYTHLACRSALPGTTNKDRRNLSHAIHADNCMIAENGTCAAEWPAYTFRDYSAIIYLNEDFEGGEFVFAADSQARIIQSTIKPRCGRMVAFSASGNNLHGVQGVLRGRRCALALWFTFDSQKLELERMLARAIVERVRADGTSHLQDENTVDPTNYEDTLFDLFESDVKLRQLYLSLRNTRIDD